MLQKLHLLMDTNPPRSVHKYVDAFRNLYAVVKSCFSDNLDPDYEIKIDLKFFDFNIWMFDF